MLCNYIEYIGHKTCGSEILFKLNRQMGVVTREKTEVQDHGTETSSQSSEEKRTLKAISKEAYQV